LVVCVIADLFQTTDLAALNNVDNSAAETSRFVNESDQIGSISE